MRLRLPENPPNISDRAIRRVWLAVGVLTALVLVAAVLVLVWFSSQTQGLARELERSDAERAKLSKRVDDEHAAAQTLAEQVKRLGGKPVVEPGEPQQGDSVAEATDAQVLAAVSVICTGVRSPCKPNQAQIKTALKVMCGGSCRGKAGQDAKPPKDGQNATDEQIDAAIARHCAEDGCRGPGPTDQQIDDRIAAYCAGGGDCGTDGKDGSVTPGDYACPDGEFIRAVHVGEDGAMTLTCAPEEVRNSPDNPLEN